MASPRAPSSRRGRTGVSRTSACCRCGACWPTSTLRRGPSPFAHSSRFTARSSCSLYSASISYDAPLTTAGLHPAPRSGKLTSVLNPRVRAPSAQPMGSETISWVVDAHKVAGVALLDKRMDYPSIADYLDNGLPKALQELQKDCLRYALGAGPAPHRRAMI